MGLTGKEATNGQRARGLRAAFLIARLLVLYLALQVSGAGPLIWGDCCSTDDDDCSGQTDRRRPCEDCPPGCPKCHCAQAPFSAPPAVETDGLVLDLLEGRLAFAPHEADAPREPPLSSIFRPPKLG